MRWIFLTISLLVFAPNAWTQGPEAIQDIIDRNPFDPNRGAKEAEEEKEEETIEDEPMAVNLPILDGIMVLGRTKVAMFTFEKEGKPMSARVEMIGEGNYDLYIREKKITKPANNRRKPARRGAQNANQNKNQRAGRAVPNLGMVKEIVEPEEDKPLFIKPIRNGKIAGYSIAEIGSDFVKLNGTKEPLRMLQEGSDKKRGGTKKAVVRKPPPKKPGARPVPKPNNRVKGQGVKRVDPKKNNNRRPPQPRNPNNTNSPKSPQDLKKKF